MHVDLEFRLKAGESARVEEYLERYPALAQDGNAVVELINSWSIEIATLDLPPANQPPVAADDSATTPVGTAVTINVLANDTDLDDDVLSVVSFTQGAEGSVVLNADDTLTYIRKPRFSILAHHQPLRSLSTPRSSAIALQWGLGLSTEEGTVSPASESRGRRRHRRRNEPTPEMGGDTLQPLLTMGLQITSGGNN